MMWKKCGLFLISFVLSHTAQGLDYLPEQLQLLQDAKKGNAEAQYDLALSLQTTTDMANLKESDFYYWLDQAAKRHYAPAQTLLDKLVAKSNPKWLASLAPNGTQKILDEVHQLDKQQPKNYALIVSKLKQAATLGNYTALAQLSWIYGDSRLATNYNVAFSTIKACTLATYNNLLHGEMNEEDKDYLCSGDILNRADWSDVQKVAEKTAAEIQQKPTALFDFLDKLK
ncbi:sel1 repeat family protein [Pasteurella sp. PK-2025]|uniref:sel1 repeat family protein n=1 Tax=Pasteurella sp. PK-2025 TaxID=3413133 RepID=UPI003C73BEC7